jgi:hypothetical protein
MPMGRRRRDDGGDDRGVDRRHEGPQTVDDVVVFRDGALRRGSAALKRVGALPLVNACANRALDRPPHLGLDFAPPQQGHTRRSMRAWARRVLSHVSHVSQTRGTGKVGHSFLGQLPTTGERISPCSDIAIPKKAASVVRADPDGYTLLIYHVGLATAATLARLALGRRPVDLSGSLAMITTGIGFHDARINCEALALDETCIHARSDPRLEHLTEDVAMFLPCGPRN